MLAKKMKQLSKIKEAVAKQLAEASQQETPVEEKVEEDQVPQQMAEQVSAPAPVKKPKKQITKFSRSASLKPVLEYWKEKAGEENHFTKSQATNVQHYLDNNPVMGRTLESDQQYGDHEEFLTFAVSPFVNEDIWKYGNLALCHPFQLKPIISNAGFSDKFMKNHFFVGKPMVGDDEFIEKLELAIYHKILDQIYKIPIKNQMDSQKFLLEDGDGLMQYFNLDFDFRFCRVVPKQAPKNLKESVLAELEEHQDNLEKLAKMLPSDGYHVEGFTIVHAFDISEEEILNQVTEILNSEDSVMSRQNFIGLTNSIKTLLYNDTVNLSLVMYQNSSVLRLADEGGMDIAPNQMMFTQIDHDSPIKQLFEESFESDSPSLYKKSDLSEEFLQFFEDYYNKESKGVLVVPLKLHGNKLGVIEISYKKELELNDYKFMLIKKLTKKFVYAVDREHREFEASIQSVILDKYTAIHPSVEWSFQDAAFDFVQQRMENEVAELQPIIYKGVFPLYGASDIRGSSSIRNKAIQSDLMDQLNTASRVIEEATKIKPMPILNEFMFRIKEQTMRLEKELIAGDEISVLGFLRGELNDLFLWLEEVYPGVRGKIEDYNNTIDGELGVFYKARRNFDESVSLLNDSISTFMDEEQAKFQSVFPHYFEKQATDGVDHSIYIGPALVKNREFHPIFLRNIRIWQLQFMCGAAYVADSLKKTLPIPLELAHLIVVQDNPITIKFSNDEKQFEVDGAYNIRYEIMKKRIDKAKIKDTGERLTQPEHLAVVYSQKKERNEYMKYIQYLQKEGYFTESLEEVDIEDLQGIHGLKALRVGINIEHIEKDGDDANEKLASVVQNSKQWLNKRRRLRDSRAAVEALITKGQEKVIKIKTKG